MKKWIEDLLSLQETDMRIRSLKARLGMIPEEIRRLDQELGQNKKNFELSKENCLKFDLDIKKVDAATKEKNAEIQKLQAQSAMVKKNEEYKALLSEIENARRRIGDLETEMLVLMDKVEDEKRKFRAEEKMFADRSRSIGEEKKGLEELVGKLKEEIAKLEVLRGEKAKPIAPEALSPYTRLLSRGTTTPFVPVSQGMCGNCHLKLTPQTVNSARKELVTQCDNCKHLIYFEE